MQIAADGQKRPLAEKFIRLKVLNVRAFLQARIVLLNLVAVNRVSQKESEI